MYQGRRLRKEAGKHLKEIVVVSKKAMGWRKLMALMKKDRMEGRNIRSKTRCRGSKGGYFKCKRREWKVE